MSNVLYPEEAVRAMLVAAYKAGFEGPLELADEMCQDIMTRATYKESDLEILEYMQEREKKKQYEEGLKARKQASRRNTYTGNAAPDFFDDQEGV